MADSILRLKVESQEYDNKLKQATQGLTRYADECRKVGGTLEVVEKETLAYVRALGQMDTTSRTATGKLAEMKKTFTELSVVYKNMTDEEKKSPFGQALAASLDQLKGRCAGAKKELDDVGKELNDTGGFMDALTSKLTVNIDAFKLLEMGLKVTKGAFDMYKSVIESTEGTADQYAIVQEQLNASVDSFFRNINEGSFASFLQGLSDVASRAKETYQAMDELSSFAVRYNPKNQADMQKIDKLLKESRALMAKGDKEGAAAKTAEATRIANQAKVNTLAYGEKEYNAGVKTLRSLLGGTGVTYTNKQLEYYSDPANWNKIKTAAGEYGTALDNLAKAEKDLADAGRTGNRKLIKSYNERYQSAKNAFDAQSESNKRAYNYLNTRDTTGTKQGEAFARATQQIYGKQMAEYAADSIQARIDRANAVATKPTGSGNGPIGNTTQQLTPLQEVQKRITDLSNEALTADKERQDAIKKEIEGLNVQVKLYKDIQDYVNGITKEAKVPEMATGFAGLSNASLSAWTNGLKQQLDQAELGSTLYQSLSEQLADTTAISNLISTAIKQGLDLSAVGLGAGEIEGFWSSILSAENITDAQLQEIVNKMNQFMGDHPIKLNVKTGEVSAENPNKGEKSGGEAHVLSEVGKMTSGISSIVSGIDSLGVKIPDGLKAVISGIQGIMSILTGISSMITAIQTLSAASSFKFFAGGGVVHAAGGYIVPGNHFSGDMVPAMLNSGEVVLNRAQAGIIASELQGGAQQAISSTPYVSGEQIYLGLNNYLRRIGKGELLTARG